MAKNNCWNCVYRGTVEGIPHCAYIFKTGHRRPCPPGDACTEKVSREVKRRKRKEAIVNG